MFPFWHDVVAPIIEAAAARRILEVGALRGENTELMLQRLGPDVELHVVDPVPDFDPAEHEKRFAGQYVFHQDLSVNVLGDLPPMDVALIDGDHNWYTVFTELTLLSEVARVADVSLPVMILHDVGWPYGRRDLYYDPTNIPDEHRQPWQRSGMWPGRTELVPGGMNCELANAEQEGGPHNGVMTAVDDFIAGYDRPLRLVVLAPYFGLAVVVEQERLARQPALAAELDRLESLEGKDMLLALGESIRLEAGVYEQAFLRRRDERIEHATSRLIDSVKRAVVNDQHAGMEVPEAREGFALTGRVGLDQLHECLDEVWAAQIPGDVAVCGTGLGGPTIFLASYLDGRDYEPRPLQRRRLWVLDRFRPADDHADLNQLRDALARFDRLDDRVRLLQGEPAATAADVDAKQLALLHLGRGVGDDARTALQALYPRLARGGALVVEDLEEPGVRAGVEAFRTEWGINTPTERVGRAGLHWFKEEAVGEPAASVAAPAAGAARSPLARRAKIGAPELSVVVVVNDMRREAARSLHALSRRYQQEIHDLNYEVLVVENGSSPDQRLGADLVQDLGREFDYLDLGTSAARSPAAALNHGIARARGRSFALMVDGAHVLTPRVLHYGTTGLRTYAPAVVVTQPWRLGPGRPGEGTHLGDDQESEDKLFEQITWPSEGYRLFEIGHSVGDRDWFDPLTESSCVFVGRDLLERVGGFDEGFALPDGADAGIDLYERLASSPGVRVVSIIGEGSFAQVHGSATTIVADPLERTRSYAELRGKPFAAPDKPMHYVGGSHSDAARQTRSRR